MSVSFPLEVVLIVCRVVSGGVDDQNAGMTGHRNLDWDLSQGVYHCKRLEIPVISVAETQGQPPTPLTPQNCPRAAISLATQWDIAHAKGNYQTRYATCATPIHTSPDPSSPIIGWV